jgi:hypothetical protein
MTAPDPPLRDLLTRAVGAGILTPEQAAALADLQTRAAAPGPPAPRRGAVLAEVLGYVGATLAVGAALFLGAELWDELGPWPRVLLLAAVTAACLLGGAALGGRDGASGRLGGFLWAAAVVGVAATAGVGADGLSDARPGTAALVAAGTALIVAAVLWWRRPAVLQHVAAFGAAVATLLAVLDRLGDGTYSWGGPLLWALGLAWVAASALPFARPTDGAGAPDASPPIERTPRSLEPSERTPRSVHPRPGVRSAGGLWRPAEPGWVLGALAVVGGPLFADDGRAAWLVVGVVSAAALVVVGVRTRRPWVAAVGTGGVFLSVPLAVAELFDARLGPLIGILAVGLVLVAAAVVLTRRGAR